MRRAWKNQSGSMGLAVLLILMALIVVGGAYFLFRAGSGPDKAPGDAHAAFEELKLRMQGVLNQPQTVNASVERNPNSFSCFYSANGSCLNSGGLFLLYEDATKSASALSQLMNGSGLAVDGSSCNNFPSANCPLRVEARWKPVCGGAHCENTRSFHLEGSVTLQASAESQPERWSQEKMFSPEFKVSQAVTCARNGNTWTGTQCLSPAEAAAYRQVASDDPRATAANVMPNNMVAPLQDEELLCPDTINIQGQLYTLERLTNARDATPEGARPPSGQRGQVHVPAMNGCPAYDSFVFQCQQKNPAQFEGEGQWVQVEAQMAPPCGEEAGAPAEMDGGDGEPQGYSRQ